MVQAEDSPSTRIYQTDLAQTPLPEILVTIHRYKAPGVVHCQRGEEIKQIFLDHGQIIFATSNQVGDSLGDKLLREGRITQEQYDESVRRLGTTKRRQGTILADMKVLDPKELFVTLRDQIQEIVWSVFSWDQGQVGFAPGRDRHLEFVKLHVSIPQAILQGVRRIPDARALVARLGTKTTVLDRTDLRPDLTLSAEESQLLAQVNGKRTLFELVNAAGLTASENARILYAFFALQLVAPKVSRQIKVQLKTDGGKYTK